MIREGCNWSYFFDPLGESANGGCLGFLSKKSHLHVPVNGF
jgi:hypothetical protein